jgi:hypothetical protein
MLCGNKRPGQERGGNTDTDRSLLLSTSIGDKGLSSARPGLCDAGDIPAESTLGDTYSSLKVDSPLLP